MTLVLTAVVAQAFAASPAGGKHAAVMDRLATSFLAYAEYLVLPVTVLSVLVFTSEYGSGLIRTTFTAVPRRRAVLAAKAAVTGAAALVVGEILAFACFFLTQAILSGRHGGLSLAHPGALRAVLAAGFVLAACALVGRRRWRGHPAHRGRHRGGDDRRHLAGGAVPGAARAVEPPAGQVHPAVRRLRGGGRASARRALLSPWLSLLVLIAWPAAALFAAAVVLTRRDV